MNKNKCKNCIHCVDDKNPYLKNDENFKYCDAYGLLDKKTGELYKPTFCQVLRDSVVGENCPRFEQKKINYSIGSILAMIFLFLWIGFLAWLSTL